MSDKSSQFNWERDAQARARHADARQRWRRRSGVAIGVFVALALIGGAAWVWLLRDEDITARAALAPPRSPFESIRPFLSNAACRTPLTPDDPLRIWIGGDSLAGSLGPALGDLAADTGVAQPTYDYRSSSGLASPSFFDWPRRAIEEMTRVDPEVVVFIIGANDSAFVRSTPLDADSRPAWRARYAQLVNEMLDVLAADDRAVYWVGSPTLRDERKNDNVEQINEVAREAVAQRARATYVDAFDLFSEPSGEYTATLPGFDGKDVRVRTADGVHFTPAGAELLGFYVFTYLDERCALLDQAVSGRRQPVRQSPGSEVSEPGTDTGTDTRAPTNTTVSTTPPPVLPSTSTSSSTTSSSLSAPVSPDTSHP